MHTLTILESASGPRALRVASLSVIGLVATATAAVGEPTNTLNATFPLDKVTLVTDIDAAIEKAGTGGTLAKALSAIADQVTPIVVVVRVAEGADAEATDAAVIAGLKLLRTAKSAVGVAPRILGAPGLDTEAVTAELAVTGARLRARCYALANAENVGDAVLYRGKFAARELMLLWPNSSPAFAGDAVARALGLRAKIDETIGWHKTISNVPIAGAMQLAHDVTFDLLDSSTEASLLNASDVTTIISEGGKRFWGNRTTAGPESPEYSFESAVATNYALQDILVAVFLPFFDHPMTVAMVKDLLESANAEFRDLKAKGKIMGAKAHLYADENSATQLAAGRPTFRIDFTPVAPLEDPTVNLVISDLFYTGFAEQLA